jgi:hypothetical protein
MAATYKGILTNNGKALIASATLNNKINYSHIAVGDGNGSVPTPLETRTALVNEKTRIALNVVEINPNNTNQIVCEAIIPTATGGFYIRELGLYAGSTMVVNASYPPTYKPLADEGGAREIALKLVINIQNADVIALYLDDSLIYSTREWVDNNYLRRNELVDNLTTSDATKPLTAKQGKVLNNSKVAHGDYGLGTSLNIPNDTLNADITLANSFWIKGTSPLPSDTPIASAYKLLNIGHASWNTQILLPAYSNQMFVRSRTVSAGAFNNWSEVAMTDSNVASATKLKNTRNIGGVSFDGTANINLPGVNIAGNQNTSGNAATATKLATSRTISLTGSVSGSKSFDGSENAELSVIVNKVDTKAYQLNASTEPTAITSGLSIDFVQASNGYPSFGTVITAKGNNTGGSTLQLYTPYDTSYGGDSLRYRTAKYNNGVPIWTLFKTILDTDNFNNYAPNKSGLGATGSWNIDISGVAASATKLATARSIGGVSFDGTANINLPGVNTSGNQNTSGNAATATKLQTSRSVAFSGAANGSFNFDGAGNTSCILTLANSGVVSGTYSSTVQIPSITVNDKGLITGISHQTIRSATVNQSGIVRLIDALNSTATDQALTAAQGKVLNDSKIAHGDYGLGTSLNIPNDTLNADITLANSFWIKGTSPLPSDTPIASAYKLLNIGLASWNTQIVLPAYSNQIFVRSRAESAGVFNSWSEVAMTDSNVASATKLKNARNIGGVSFDGTANINLPGVNTVGNQNTTGNAASATKWATTRTISLTGASTGSAQMDGSGDITIATEGLGVGQTWQDLTAIRSTSTTFTNSTGKPIQVAVTTNFSISSFYVDGNQVSVTGDGNNNITATHVFIIPNGSTYSFSGSLKKWWELR